MKKAYKEKINSVFVLGSTSFVAQDICRELANRGCKKFTLYGRNRKKNEQFKNELQDKFDVLVELFFFDLLNDKLHIPDIHEHDLYLISVGILGDTKIAISDYNEALKIANINFTNLIPWITKITSNERLSKFGRLWIFSSVAGDIGRPSNYHYGASKSALTIFCQGLFYRTHNKPFLIRIFKAGYLATPETLSLTSKKLCLNTVHLAKRILDSPNKEGIEYLPWWWFVVMNLLRFLPPAIISRI